MQSRSNGTCYWITGLAGSGKTTLGRLLYKHFKECKGNTVYLDGDILREVLDAKEMYSLEERKDLAMCYSRLCNMLTQQGLDVICATISMFHDVREWNRGNIEKYQEIYIKVPMEVLFERDQKQLYSSAQKEVVGLDLPIEEPDSPDLVLINDGTVQPKILVDRILEHTAG